MSFYTAEATDGAARAGVLRTRRGDVPTPLFMVVGTRGAVKAAVDPVDLHACGTTVLLCNTYHLALKPGEDRVQKLGGLHDFSQWKGPILTDSGGFQVFSLRNTKITDEGVHFQSHYDGTPLYIDAERSMEIQHKLGADMIMCFDDCPPHTPDRARISQAVTRTTAWAERSQNHLKKLGSTAALFGIVQGGCYADLRRKSLSELLKLDFDGYALGGLAVGETEQKMYAVLDEMVQQMPAEKPRYLMGVGTPTNLLQAIGRGVDMFDCVLPMRNARHGIAYTWDGALRIKNAPFREDPRPLDPNVKSPASPFSRAYIHHLMRVGEALGQRLMTLHNIAFYQQLMTAARGQIVAGTYHTWAQNWINKWSQ